MTRKEMITACVEDQIKRGIAKPEYKAMLIKAYLTGGSRMSYSDCVRWYNETFKTA